jgi:hypothetical protein
MTSTPAEIDSINDHDVYDGKATFADAMRNSRHPPNPLTRYRRWVKPPTPGLPGPAAGPLALPENVTITRTGLVITGQLDIEEWVLVGGALAQLEEGLQWSIGDWWHWGYHRYGERQALVKAKKIFRYSFSTLMNFGWVAGRVETSRRREVLSFTHHAEVAKFEPCDQGRWLDLAVREKLSVLKFRDKIKTDEFERKQLPGQNEDPMLRRLKRLRKAAQKAIPRALDLDLVPPWKQTDLKLYLMRSNPFYLTELVEDIERAKDFWTKTLEFVRPYSCKRGCCGPVRSKVTPKEEPLPDLQEAA